MQFEYSYDKRRKYPHALTITHVPKSASFSWKEVDDRNHFVRHCGLLFDITYSLVRETVYFRTHYDALKAKMLYVDRKVQKSKRLNPFEEQW